MMTTIKDEISIYISTIQAVIYKDFLCDVLYHKAWTTKQKVLKQLFGSYKESFQMLLRVLLAIIESNPSIFVKWDHKMIDDNKTLFIRVF
jgi:hypothetical protein